MIPSSKSFCSLFCSSVLLFFFNDTATTEIYTLSLHDALPISGRHRRGHLQDRLTARGPGDAGRSEEHTSELQSQSNLVYRLLLVKKNSKRKHNCHRASSSKSPRSLPWDRTV